MFVENESSVNKHHYVLIYGKMSSRQNYHFQESKHLKNNQKMRPFALTVNDFKPLNIPSTQIPHPFPPLLVKRKKKQKNYIRHLTGIQNTPPKLLKPKNQNK